jgi:hypothetical protein
MRLLHLMLLVCSLECSQLAHSSFYRGIISYSFVIMTPFYFFFCNNDRIRYVFQKYFEINLDAIDVLSLLSPQIEQEGDLKMENVGGF